MKEIKALYLKLGHVIEVLETAEPTQKAHTKVKDKFGGWIEIKNDHIEVISYENEADCDGTKHSSHGTKVTQSTASIFGK